MKAIKEQNEGGQSLEAFKQLQTIKEEEI